MPLSPVFSARVPLVTGIVNDENRGVVHHLAMFIKEDVFLSKMVIGIEVKSNEFTLRLRDVDFTIALGDTTQLSPKFSNLKAFYQKAAKDETLNAYRHVNLKYNNQVVCTKI